VVDDDGTAAADNDAKVAAGIGPKEHGKGMVHGNCRGSLVQRKTCVLFGCHLKFLHVHADDN
jgi:hypothetical protein